MLQQFCLVYCCHWDLHPIPAAKRRSIFQLQRRPPSTQMPYRPAKMPYRPGTHSSPPHSPLQRSSPPRSCRDRPPSILAATSRSSWPVARPHTATPSHPRAALPRAALFRVSAAPPHHGAVPRAAMPSPTRPCPTHPPPSPRLISVSGRGYTATCNRPPRVPPTRRCCGLPSRRRPRHGHAFPRTVVPGTLPLICCLLLYGVADACFLRHAARRDTRAPRATLPERSVRTSDD